MGITSPGAGPGPRGCETTSGEPRDGRAPSRGQAARGTDRGAAYEGWEPPSADAAYDPSYDPSPLPDVPQSPPHYTFAPPPAYPPPYYQAPPPAYGGAYPYPYPYAYPYYYPPKPPPNPAFPMVGGVLSILSGALNLVFMGFASALMVDAGVCVAIMLVFSILAILGGICALFRRLFGMAIVGAIFAMLSPITFGAGFVMGLIALILIAIGKDAFEPVGGVPQYPPSAYPPPPY